jgi:hypothetical protein
VEHLDELRETKPGTAARRLQKPFEGCSAKNA